MHKPVLEFKNVFASASKSAGLGKIRSMDLCVRQRDTLVILNMRNPERRVFIDMVTAMTHPEEGSVLIKEKDPTKLSERELNSVRGRIGLVTSPPVFLNNVRIMENIRLPLRYHSRKSTKSIDAVLRGIFDLLGIEEFADVIPNNIDHGFLGLAALARALSLYPDLLVLERPTEYLEEAFLEKLPRIWEKYVIEHGGSVIVLTNDTSAASSLSESPVIFENGKITGPEKARED